MAERLTKATLYAQIDMIRHKLSLVSPSSGIHLIDYLNKANNVFVTTQNFHTPKLRAMCSFGKSPHKDVIILNAYRNNLEQNFDCGHELMHLFLHRYISEGSFNCFDNQLDRNDYIEWQANEGAAEFLVPYKVFIPNLCEHFGRITASSNAMHIFISSQSAFFNVPYTVIEYRINTLKYEIAQYLDGVSLENLDILSNTQQNNKSIHIVSPILLSQVADFTPPANVLLST